jgi:Ca2+/Na+ antiporter
MKIFKKIILDSVLIITGLIIIIISVISSSHLGIYGLIPMFFFLSLFVFEIILIAYLRVQFRRKYYDPKAPEIGTYDKKLVRVYIYSFIFFIFITIVIYTIQKAK